jgi:Tfp pilus assembly protein PilV
MPTFPALTRFVGRACGSLDRARNGRLVLTSIERAKSDTGLSLIEVIASALIVGLIAIGTLTGFASADRASANSRQHSQALLLATQNEERLRGMNVTELGRLGAKTLPTITENGTVYTIEEQAHFVSVAKEEFACEASPATADYIQTTSNVTWRSLGNTGSTQSISQSSLIPVPASTSLLVNVRNQVNEPVEGATVSVVGKTSGSNQQNTPASGCVIFGALPESKVNVTATKAGWVNEQNEQEPAAQEVTLSTTSLVTEGFVIAEPGSVEAQFKSGSTTGIQGETIYVAHTGLNKGVTAGTANSPVTSVRASGLFPYATPGNPPGENQYTVYAGDCEANDPHKASSSVMDRAAQVTPGGVKSVEVELPEVRVSVYEGTSSSSPGSLDNNAEAKITNVGCTGSTVRVMKVVSGALERRYQPYGKLKLCVSQVFSGTRYTYSGEFANAAPAGVTLNAVYLKSSTYKGGAQCT